MDYFPAFTRLQDARVLVIGAGDVALRKIELLLDSGASVAVVAHAAHPTIADWADSGRVSLRLGDYDKGDLTGSRLVFAATNDAGLNRRIAADAGEAGLLVNVVDDPDYCTFITPAIVDRSPLLIAIGSGGAAPVLARRLRENIERMLPKGIGGLAAAAGKLRSEVKLKLREGNSRRYFWEQVFDGPLTERLTTVPQGESERALRGVLNDYSAEKPAGEVYLVGGGPGDPELLTLKAVRLMQNCDVVLYDRLVSDEVMKRVRKDAERVYVGKKRDQHTVPQDQINELLVEYAQKGKRVLRLKGGDPFIFGRGGEEIETLMAAGVPFQVVPGITAASGCATYGGIPLTHRDYAQSCVFVTGHRKDGQLNLDWTQLAKPAQTVVFYMGVQSLGQICSQLVANGAPADRSIAVVERGTTPQQRTLVGTLSTMVEIAAEAKVQPPSLILVGDVVKLQSKLGWFESA